MPVRAVLVTVVLALAAAPAAGATAAAPHAVSCKNGVVAKISGKRTCLASGRACISSRQSQYKKHGYSCSKGRLRKIKQEF